MYATAWSFVTHHRINDIDSMQPRFDFQAAADTILNSGDVLVTDAEALGQIDPAPERDILIDGDLQQGTAFQSQQSLVVNGSIRGLENNTCRIEARQDLLIAGDACHAHLEGRNIHIGGGSKASELRAQEQISLGADMVATKLKVGNGGSCNGAAKICAGGWFATSRANSGAIVSGRRMRRFSIAHAS